MRRQRRFQAATERRAVDRGNDRFVEGFHAIEDGRQPRLLDRPAEFGDVRTRDESPARTDDQQRLAVIVLGLVECLHQSLSHGLRQRVDRWVIDGYDADLARKYVIHRGRHAYSFANDGSLCMVLIA